MFLASNRLILSSLAVAALATACPSSEKKDPATAADAGAATATSTSANAPIELPPGTGPVASVNGVEIPRDPFNKEYKVTLERYQKARHEVQPALRERLKDNIVRRLVDAELIRQQSEKLAVVVAPEEKEKQWDEHKKRYGTEEAFKSFLERAGTTADDVRSQFEANLLREKVFAKVSESVTVPAAEVKDFYDKNTARYDEPEQIQASHILIRLNPQGTAEEKAQKKARAEEALKKVKAKGADFAALSKEYGEDPTKDRGGDLGWFTKGRMVKPFEDAAWALKDKQISGIVETQFGFHIIKKTGYKAARKKTFKEVEDQIQKSLLAKKKNEAIRDALAKWKNEAKIELFVKGDEAIMSAGKPTGGPNMLPNMVHKDQTNPGNVQIQRLTPPTTKDTPVQPQEGQPQQ